MHSNSPLRPLAATLSLLLCSAPAAAQAGTVFDIPLSAAHQRVLYDAPPDPRVTIVMFPGGAGDIGLRRDGTIRHADNFVVRTRAAWLALGDAVLIPDAIDGDDLRGQRSTPAYAAIIRALIAFARERSPAPIVLLGTSQGSIAAMNGAAHDPSGALAGLVLTESVSRLGASGETVFSADPQAVRVPTLVVANHDDRCKVALPTDASRIAAALTHARVQILTVSGGIEQTRDPCGSMSPHGYDGIEQPVIDAIDRWMRRAERAGAPPLTPPRAGPLEPLDYAPHAPT